MLCLILYYFYFQFNFSHSNRCDAMRCVVFSSAGILSDGKRNGTGTGTYTCKQSNNVKVFKTIDFFFLLLSIVFVLSIRRIDWNMAEILSALVGCVPHHAISSIRSVLLLVFQYLFEFHFR